MLREVRLLRAGYCLVDRTQLVTGEPPGRLERVPIWTYLLRGDDVLALVDTGMPPDCVGREDYSADEGGGDQIRPQMRAEDAIDQVLARQGLHVGDIDLVICTHGHFDHAGGIRSFRAQPVLVHREELAALRADPPLWVDPDLNYEAVEDNSSPLCGVTLLHTPGHTPGHLSLLLRPEGRRPLLLTADAVYLRENWERDIPGAMTDADAGRRSVARLRALAVQVGADVFFGHDPHQSEDPLWRPLVRA